MEWLRRRVISSARAIARRKVVVQSMRFRSLALIFLAPSALLEKLSKSNHPPVCGASYAVTITPGLFETSKLYRNKLLVHGPGIFVITKFSEKLAQARGSGI